MNEEIMTVEEVASYLKVDTRTIYRRLKSKDIPAFKFGGQWRFKKQDIDMWIKKRYSSKEPSIDIVAENIKIDAEQTVQVPVVGKASCGKPILAEENIESTIPVSTKIARPPYKYFFLRAKGDSMNLAGINDGDLVLVRQQQTAQNKDIVVALIDDEATIKEYNIMDDKVILKPKSDNPVHKPIIVTRDLKIQGIVVSTISNI
ncbi:MAG: transcriptional repressor LexA [Candidatus Goldbacteria bacterium]|nr:transcriptional repressor LexA [Candidatus Goldiibacteriota bacterium]